MAPSTLSAPSAADNHGKRVAMVAMSAIPQVLQAGDPRPTLPQRLQAPCHGTSPESSGDAPAVPLRTAGHRPPMRLPLTAVAVLVAYVVAITAFGTWLGRRRRSVADYFLAGRTVPWWAIASCVVATETSTLTFIGAPGTAYNGNWTFL